MIKINKENLVKKINSMLEVLPVKKIICCNHGIGDFIITSRVAKFIGCGILQKVCNDTMYRKLLCRKLAQFENVKREEVLVCPGPNYEIQNNIEQLYPNIIIKQYKCPELYSFSTEKNENDFMKKAMSVSFNIKPKAKIKNLIFLCPSGSRSHSNYRRHLHKEELDYIISKLTSFGKNIYLVGIEKDIEKYGFYKNVRWINTQKIIDDSGAEQQISVQFFLEIVSCAESAITVDTYFHFITDIMKIPTYVIHSVNDRNEAVIGTYEKSFFLNLKWFTHTTIATISEILNILS